MSKRKRYSPEYKRELRIPMMVTGRSGDRDRRGA
jgi:hypothetical protein